MNSDKNIFRNIVVLTIIAVILSILSLVVPSLGILFLWIGAIFACISYISDNNINIVFPIVIYSVVQYAFLGNIQYAIMSTCIFVIPMVILGKTMKNKDLDESAYLICTVIMAIVIMYLAKQVLSDASFVSGVKQSLDSAISTIKLSNSSYNFPVEFNSDSMIKKMKELFPATVIVVSLLYVIIGKYIATAIIKRRFKDKSLELKSFGEFVIPSKLGFLFMVFYLGANLMTFTGNMDKEYYQILTTNILYVMTFIIMIDGMAVIIYAMRTINSKFLKNLVIIILMFLFFILNIPLVVLGVLDMIFDFRKLGFRRKK